MLNFASLTEHLDSIYFLMDTIRLFIACMLHVNNEQTTIVEAMTLFEQQNLYY